MLLGSSFLSLIIGISAGQEETNPTRTEVGRMKNNDERQKVCESFKNLQIDNIEESYQGYKNDDVKKYTPLNIDDASIVYKICTIYDIVEYLSIGSENFQESKKKIQDCFLEEENIEKKYENMHSIFFDEIYKNAVFDLNLKNLVPPKKTEVDSNIVIKKFKNKLETLLSKECIITTELKKNFIIYMLKSFKDDDALCKTKDIDYIASLSKDIAVELNETFIDSILSLVYSVMTSSLSLSVFYSLLEIIAKSNTEVV